MKANKRVAMIMLVIMLAIGIVFGGPAAYKEYQNERVAKALMAND